MSANCHQKSSYINFLVYSLSGNCAVFVFWCCLSVCLGSFFLYFISWQSLSGLQWKATVLLNYQGQASSILFIKCMYSVWCCVCLLVVCLPFLVAFNDNVYWKCILTLLDKGLADGHHDLCTLLFSGNNSSFCIKAPQRWVSIYLLFLSEWKHGI